MNKCPNCGADIPIPSNFCIECGYDLSHCTFITSADEELNDDKSYSYSKTWKKHKNRKRIIIGSISLVVTALLVVCIILIGSSVSATRNKAYNRLLNTMQTLSETDIKEKDSFFYRLPNSYKNVRKIKEEFDVIDTLYKKMNVNIDNINSNSEKARLLYIELWKFDEEHDNWDLSNFLKAINVIDTVVYGVTFTDELEKLDSYYFTWSDSSTGGQTLNTNLPSNRSESNNYYFYTAARNGRLCFGLNNVDNSKDTFIAYRIDDIQIVNNEFKIEIYCFSNKEKYTLHYLMEV